MRAAPTAWVHASAAVVGEAGVLVRGPSGTGKTSLTLALVAEARRDRLFARLVADDRVGLVARGGRLVARPHPRTAGLVERRGLGIAPEPHEPACVVRLVLDLVPPEDGPPPRLPAPEECRTELAGIALPCLRVPCGAPAPWLASLVLHRLTTPLVPDRGPPI